MANIHAINAQGTEYGITAENGISQAQAAAIATIGDVADLETTAKTTLVSAVNEVNGKFAKETVLYENQDPLADQSSVQLPFTGIANAKALKITHGLYSINEISLKEDTFPLIQNTVKKILLSQVNFDSSETEQQTHARQIIIVEDNSLAMITNGTLYTYNKNNGTTTVTSSNESEKVIKIVALF